MADEHNANLNGGTEQGNEGNGQDNIGDNNAQVTKELQSSGGDDKKLSTEKVKTEKVKTEKVKDEKVKTAKVKEEKVEANERAIPENPKEVKRGELVTFSISKESLFAAIKKGVNVVEFDLKRKKAIYTITTNVACIPQTTNEERTFDSSQQAQQTALSEQYKKDTLVVINGRLAALCEKRLKDFGFVLEFLQLNQEAKNDNAFVIYTNPAKIEEA